MKKAFITGISGQDGSYLSELLLEKGYQIHGLVMRNELEDSDHALAMLSGTIDKISLHPGSIESYPSLLNIIEEIQPDECYHLAAASFVSYSFDDEFSTFNININGTHNILSAIKKSAPNCKFYFAGSSELFGRAKNYPQDENTPFNPRSVYGITKATGYYLTSNYRENYGMYACTGILYNHESPRRGHEYVTRKITHGAAQIKLGIKNELRLGNLDSKRDWGYAGDYVQAMWLLMNQEHPKDYVISSGELHSIREVCEVAFGNLGLHYQDYVIIDPKFFRPVEIVPLVGDSTLARTELGWMPKVHFQELIEMMVKSDYDNLSNT